MNYNNKTIAILGATSHIAKGLIYNFSKSNNYNVFLFARSPKKVEDFVKNLDISSGFHIENFSEFNNNKYDCVINCIGISRSANIEDVLELTENYDNLVITYLKQNKKCLYINFSSGAVYGNYCEPAEIKSTCSIEINNIKPENYYSIAKINSEAKHRALKELNIVDIRVFSYFSRFIDLSSGFLITEIINSIKNKTVFKTNKENIIRDYSNPTDLFSVVLKCIDKHKINDVFDVYSKSPVSKVDLLDFYSKKYGLKYKIDEKCLIKNSTGNKVSYFSKNKKAKEIGFNPKYSSLEAIEYESKFILNK
ncbi:MAG: NAD(P)-dependent oxidoreductase [Bacteroidales bacterium]|nr:NAD(P)-dependent oxidoreductase [Bacteroidales bacterium]